MPDNVLGAPSDGNSSRAALASGGTYTGTWERNSYPDVMVSCQTDSDGTLYFDFSNDDGANYSTFPTGGFAVASGIHEFHTAIKGPRSFRVRLVNGSGTPTYLRLHTYYGVFRQANAPLTQVIAQDSDAIVTRTDTEDEVMRGKVSGEYILPKFGRNPDVDGAEDIWNGGGDYTGFPTTTAEEFQVLSSSASDTAAGTGARTIRVYYLNSAYEMFDSTGAYLSFDVTLNGTTSVNSGVTGMRVWRAVVLTSGSGQTNAGNITVRWRTTTSVIFCLIPTGFAHTQISNFTIPAGYTGYLKSYRASMDDLTSNSATLALKVRDFGSNTFRLRRPFVISTTKDVSVQLYGGDQLSEKTDLCFRATSVANANGIVTCGYGLRLVKN